MNLKYPLYNLNDEDFEKLSALICEQILGAGTIVFSSGKDGGRDAKFTGKADNFPSKSEPWDGRFIIQAKHTTKPVASCSDSKFKTILKDELPKLRELKKQSKIDFYLVFTNRKLSGLQDPKIENLIDEETGVENCVLGEERIQLWLQEYPGIVKTLGLNKLLMPLEFYEKDLQEIVVAFSESKISKEELKTIQHDLVRIPIEEKNKLNNLGKEYFDNVLTSSFSDFERIKSFLKDPQNEEYKKMYNNTVSDLQAKIILKKNEFYAFEEVLEHICDYVLDTQKTELLNNRKLIRVFLHYMYFYCDIGIKESEQC